MLDHIGFLTISQKGLRTTFLVWSGLVLKYETMMILMWFLKPIGLIAAFKARFKEKHEVSVFIFERFLHRKTIRAYREPKKLAVLRRGCFFSTLTKERSLISHSRLPAHKCYSIRAFRLASSLENKNIIQIYVIIFFFLIHPFVGEIESGQRKLERNINRSAE
jgi:hypothetical protein